MLACRLTGSDVQTVFLLYVKSNRRQVLGYQEKELEVVWLFLSPMSSERSLHLPTVKTIPVLWMLIIRWEG